VISLKKLRFYYRFIYERKKVLFYKNYHIITILFIIYYKKVCNFVEKITISLQVYLQYMKKVLFLSKKLRFYQVNYHIVCNFVEKITISLQVYFTIYEKSVISIKKKFRFLSKNYYIIYNLLKKCNFYY
jgi:hypothetical protein